MTSPVIKRSIVLQGHKTSISIEEPFWISLKEIARDSGLTLSKLVTQIEANRLAGSNLSSAIRVHILERLRARLGDLNAGNTVTAAGPTGQASVPPRT